MQESDQNLEQVAAGARQSQAPADQDSFKTEMSKNQKRNFRRKKQKQSQDEMSQTEIKTAKNGRQTQRMTAQLTKQPSQTPVQTKKSVLHPPKAEPQVEPRPQQQFQGRPPRQYPYNKYEQNVVHLEVHSVELNKNQAAVDVLVALKVGEKSIPDNGQYSKFYREKTAEEIPERTKSEIFELDKQTFEMQPKDIQKFYRSRYFLFSKFDRGIQIDKEGWYSVTPEPFAKYLAQRVESTFKQQTNGAHLHEHEEEQVNVLDAFGGVGGNVIQFAQRGFCVGLDLEPCKVSYMTNNAKVYGLREGLDFQILERDFLHLESYRQINLMADDPSANILRFPQTNANKQFNAVFLSPPWGGTGYNLMDEYALEHIFPDFDCIIEKATEYSPNLMIFLPRNTSIKDLVQRLSKFQNKLIGEKRKVQLDGINENHQHQVSAGGEGQISPIGELTIEVEALSIGTKVTAIIVYTGDLARVGPKEVAQNFIDSQCQHFNSQPTHLSQGGAVSHGTSRTGSSASSVKSGTSSTMTSQPDYMKQILFNIFTHAGYKYFAKYVKRTGKSKLSLQKVVKQLQKSFSPEEWYYFRKIHKKANNYFLNKGGQKGDLGGGGWVSFDSKVSKSVTSKVSKYSSGAASIEETKTGVSHKSNLHSHSAARRGSRKNMQINGRMRTLSNSEMSSSKGSIDEAGMTGDNDSLTESHFMNMIDEVHMSEESEKSVDKPTFFDIEGIAAGEDDNLSEISTPEEEWTKVTKRNRSHIELKDLTENDFLSLIEAKNQDKRYYGWLNFQPIFGELENKEHDKEETEMEDDEFLCFTDLFGLKDDLEDDGMQVDEQMPAASHHSQDKHN